MTAPYQLLPPLSDAELQELATSINEHGVMVPVLVDEDGVVIDGHHRQRIADDLGIDYPVVQRADLSDADKRTLALSLNLHRRHLTRDQKRAVIAASLTADPELSNRQHAERTGASPTTVGAVREELEERGDVSKLDTRTDSLGRSAPATKPPRPEPTPEPAPLRCPYCNDDDTPGAELVMTLAGWACPDCDNVEPEDLAEPEPEAPPAATDDQVRAAVRQAAEKHKAHVAAVRQSMAPETIEQRNAREAEQRRADHNDDFAKALRCLATFTTNPEFVAEQWRPEDTVLAELWPDQFTAAAIRTVGGQLLALAVQWEKIHG